MLQDGVLPLLMFDPKLFQIINKLAINAYLHHECPAQVLKLLVQDETDD